MFLVCFTSGPNNVRVLDHIDSRSSPAAECALVVAALFIDLEAEIQVVVRSAEAVLLDIRKHPLPRVFGELVDEVVNPRVAHSETKQMGGVMSTSRESTGLEVNAEELLQ